MNNTPAHSPPPAGGGTPIEGTETSREDVGPLLKKDSRASATLQSRQYYSRTDSSGPVSKLGYQAVLTSTQQGVYEIGHDSDYNSRDSSAKSTADQPTDMRPPLLSPKTVPQPSRPMEPGALSQDLDLSGELRYERFKAKVAELLKKNNAA
jgi:hypothetical protein